MGTSAGGFDFAFSELEGYALRASSPSIIPMSGFLFRFIYTGLFYLFLPLLFIRLLWRSIKEPEYLKAPWERLGFYRSSHPGEVIWVHAVSAGETIAAAPLIQKLTAAGKRCLLTNMTPTGRERARKLLPQVENCYAPWDLPTALARFIRQNRPKMLVLIDTEIWPNTIQQCQKNGIKVLLVNGRMSASSARGYQRIAPLSRPMMLALSRVAAQTQQHANRFIALGVPAERLVITGSIKSDAPYPEEHQSRQEAARRLTASRPLVTAASTHEGEELQLLNTLPALQMAVPHALLVLAPRHPRRSDSVAQLIRAQGYEAVRFSDPRTHQQVLDKSQQVLLLDVMGELETFLSITRVAFIGGSLVPVGGHNLLEAVRAGAAVLMGPHLENIEDIAQQFIDKEAMLVVANEAELKTQLLNLMQDEDKAARMSQAATAVLASISGALQEVYELLLEMLE